ncbi:MAG: hypothetical protein U0929_16115 [Planctomycetaceae bacterium]
MNETRQQRKWLRRGLVTLVGLLAVTVTSGVIWALLVSLGDQVGTRAFRVVTCVIGAASAMCALSLLIGAVWTLIQLVEQRDGPSDSSGAGA